MTVWCRINLKCSVSSKGEKNLHSFPYKQDPTLLPKCTTDHRASSVHFNILLMRVYRCALLERWFAHQPVESHTSNLLWIVSDMDRYMCNGLKIMMGHFMTWGRRLIWKMWGGGVKNFHSKLIPDILICFHNFVCLLENILKAGNKISAKKQISRSYFCNMLFWGKLQEKLIWIFTVSMLLGFKIIIW